jgi:hypothetical protein
VEYGGKTILNYYYEKIVEELMVGNLYQKINEGER